ncbi:hypothetical protein AVEN_92178-1, partial [Araneus ventricosus]
MQDHDEQNPHKCNQCPMAFHGKGRLRKHYECHMEEKPFKCNYCCDYASKRKENLKRHIGYRHESQLSSQQIPSKKKFKCEKCSRKFIKESAFNAHVLNICDPNRFTCDQCSSKFRFESKLIHHYRVHTGEKPFKCDHCAYAASSK